ncbi:tetratricopeptide repeat protein [Streptomyces violens]|uniref:tetratricopeptide repeat protein n=1 Tax=Streptomyces violens TaxID=66377 RepID=UPI0012FE8ADB|nr:tetratricopeptide repeat protein [Streptomyces violens]
MSVGGAVSACTVIVGGRMQAWIERSSMQREQVAKALAVAGTDGLLPRVAEVSDAIRLGVHPARTDQGGEPSLAGGLPAYIPRSIDDELRTAVAREAFVLLVGESTAGKSRSAFEAMRAAIPSHHLAVPVDRTAVIPLAEYVSRRAEPAVLWLDDLECFLGSDALSPQLLSELTSRPGVVVVATIRSSQHQRFTARTEPSGDEQERTAWRANRHVLKLAHTCYLDRIWSPQELEVASSFADDPRIARALHRTHVFGLAEALAAGPELLRDWHAAWEAGAHPRAAALVTAAVDCRRIGLDAPASRELLEELHHHYLAARGGHALRPESLEEAWRWALQPVHGASSLIVPSGTSGNPCFMAFDYLVDQPHQASIPAETWDTVIRHADTTRMPSIAGKALWHQRRAFHQALDAGLVEGVFFRASALADRHHYAEAIAVLSQELESLENEDNAGDDRLSHRTSLRHQIAFYTMLMGNPAEAEAAFRALLAEHEAVLLPGDETLHVVRHNLASCARRRGDLAGALAQFRALLADREEYLGPTAMNTLDTRRIIARLVADMGDPAEALRQAREVLAAEEEHLGADHINTLETRCRIADFLARTGDHTAALKVLDRCLPDLVRTNGQEHPAVLNARQQHATSLWENGRHAEALEEFTQVLAIRDRRYGPDDPTTRQARTELAQLRSRYQS